MINSVLHPLTEQQINNFTQAPVHGVLLMGTAGSGKLALATSLAENILQLAPGKFADYGYGLVVRPQDGKAISIEAIRELEHFFSLKVPSQQVFNRAVIIEDAHLLTLEAQNALLKTLEEPPAGSLLILTASHSQSLLPTIRSRIQPIAVRRPSREAIETYFKKQDFTSEEIQQAYSMAAGLPGLMSALLGEADHPLRAATEQARQLLSQTTYNRLLAVDELAKQRDLARDTLFILEQMAHLGLQTATGGAARKWQTILEASYAAAEALRSNAQPKLALTNLMLQL